MSAATMNGGDVASKTNSSTPAAASKQQLKSSSSTNKSLDASRKQSGSPVDGQNKKQQPPKAWQGPNPITQRASNNLPNGNEKPLPKLPSQAQSQQPKTSSDLHADKHAHDRTIFLFSQFIGKDVTLTLKNGEQFTGVFSGASLESSKTQYVLKMVRRTSAPQANGNSDTSEYIGEGEDHVMSFDIQDTIDLAVPDVSTTAATPHQNGSIEASFLTDTQISGRDPAMPRERDLQRWEPGPEADIDMSLEASGDTSWDQFAANERMYGVQSTYDEDIYTTTIDRSRPDYKRLEAQADRIAREIEGSAAANPHVAEERRKDAHRDDAGDEEEKYSGVRRESSLPKRAAGAYVPPSQRPITSTPSVPGAPFDPAIISSQISTKSAVAPAETSAPSAPPATADVTSEATVTQPPKKRENTTEDRVRDTADAFKHFANTEKLRLRQAAEAKRANQRQEKNVKLNDLKKFAANFKLKSRVPDDLVPILAKDREKQLEIQAKADQAYKDEEVTKTKEKVTDKPASAVSPAASVATAQPGNASAVDQRTPFNQHRARVSQQGRPQIPGQGASPRAPLSQRIQGNQFFNNRQNVPQPLPADLRIPPPAPSADMPMSPSSATRLNVNAKSFEFRPGASAFTPTGTSPSPQRTGSVAASPSDSSTAFLGKKSKASKGSSPYYSAVKRMKQVQYNEQEKKKFASNGGLPQAYNTLPTWPTSKANENKMFRETFPQGQAPSQGPSPMQTPNPNGQMPHAHQLPAHMQGGPNMSAQPPRPHFYPQPGHGHGPSFDPRMQPSFGPNASVQNSPRAQQIPVAPFNGQMPPMPVQQFPGQPVPGYGMSPSMQYRQPSMQGGPPMMMPGQMGGQMGPMQPGYPPNHQFRGPQMGGHMMVQQPSQGYVNGPMPQQGYSPMPPHAQPHMPHMQQHGGPAGYSGSPRPTMMQHNGSHQGFQPGMPMQPHFVPSPGQPHPYHLQQHRAMSGGYPQMTPRQQNAVPNHSSPGMGAQGDEGK
ncbi:hypothetical protein PRZ48_012324 [Zasmidium cellare]|uniref:LsmAD domain-containing protein n=1 Tax=Zasmidium cellare TaxID=395010 RepID=A0ABR0E4J9_ZASCE|nr:hypothetical protein PRZ48_012324 [Zasmidium cellare]